MKKEYCYFLFAFLLILCFSHPLPGTRENSSPIDKTYSLQDSKSDKVEKSHFSEKSPNHEVKTKRKLQEKDKPIDIFVDLTALEKEENRNEHNLTLDDIEEAINEVTQTLKSLINVTNVERTISISEEELTDNGFSEGYYNTSLKDGIKTDLIIIIRYSNINDGMNTLIAKPKIIKTNGEDSRPEAGRVILNPDFGLAENNKKEYLKFLFLHEFTHILGFLYDIMNTKGLIMDSDPLITRTKNGINKKALKSTTRVVKYASEYFGCPNLSYLELEDQTNFEGQELKNSHWEARLLLGEYMTSEPYFGDQVISEFTLYLLEDLDFYATNKYTGGLMKFGKKKDCQFLGYKEPTSTTQYDCLIKSGSDNVPQFHNEFCKGVTKQTCSSGRQSRTYCIQDLASNVKDSDYSSYYNRGWSLVGRRNADYCPVSDNFDGEDIIDHYVGNCQLGSPKYGSKIYYDISGQEHDSSMFDETVGQNTTSNSFCALSSLVYINDDKKTKYKETIRPTCYPMFCSSQSLTIKIYQQYFVCPQGGGIMQITNYEGYIYCPEYNLICTGTSLCNNMFDCVDKKSEAKGDLIYTVNDNGAVIEGETTDSDILANKHQIVKGYELSDDDDSKCPKYCFECVENRRCFQCDDNKTYYLTGTRENDQEPIKCNETKPSDYYYNNSNYKIGRKTGLTVYFNCREGCKRCTNGDDCSVCSPTHYLKTKQCIERIEHCLSYDNTSNTSVVEHSPDNGGELAYTQCELCDYTNKYYCLNKSGTNDLKKCYLILEMKQYYKPANEKCFIECSEKIRNCQECDNSTKCNKCRTGYVLKSDLECILNVTSLVSGPCEIKTSYIMGKLDEHLIPTLVKDYVDNLELSTSKVSHLVNENEDYTITIFINSSCTEGLLEYGYYSIDDHEITEKMVDELDDYFQKGDPAITVFISYGAKNYSLMVFTFGGYEITLDQCSGCQNMKVQIENNFTRIINKTLGGIVLDMVKNSEFDVFDENSGEFTTLCKNVSLVGIDVPLFKRKNYFYMNEFSNSYSCRADICIPTEKLFRETTAYCNCSLPNKIDYDLESKEFTFYNVSDNSKNKAKDAFIVFGCVEDTFDSKHISKNFGFYVAVISIILQCILFIIYVLAGKPINFSKGTVASTSNPPKRVAMKINADWIKANLLNEHDEEKDIQSKDEIDDEFVMEEFNYNIDKHDTSSYSVDTDLAKKQIGDNKDTEKDGLAEKPDGKKKKKILILLPDKTQKDEDSDQLDDDFSPSKDKKQEKKNFFQIYWIILSLKQHIINYFSGIKWLKITESYVPKFIMGIRSLFMIVFVFFVNAMFLSQDYFDKKFEHFNQKYNFIPAYVNMKISGGEKFNYGFGHTAAYAFYTFLIYLAVQLIFGLFVFSVRKELTELFNSKDVLKINSLAKTLKAKYIVYFVIVIILMIAFFIYLTNFNGVYVGSGNDFGPAGLLSLIFIEIFPFIWSLILALFRYFGIVCQSKVLYGISQVFMF